MLVKGGASRGGGGGEEQRSSSSVGVSLQWQEAKQEHKEHQQLLHLHKGEKKKKEEEGIQDSPSTTATTATTATASRGLLKRCVDTRERGEEELRQREAQQLDFRSLLGRRALNVRNNQEEELKKAGLTTTAAEHRHHHQMDFKANLKGVKAKADEDRKGSAPQQVDFRSVLGKKGPAGNKPTETPGKNGTDFRSVLANKKKPADPENNGDSGKPAVNNCVDGANNEKKSDGAGGGKMPEFVEKLSDVTVLDGQRLRLQCRLADSDPAGVTVTWTLDGKIIKASKFIILANEGQRSHTKTPVTDKHNVRVKCNIFSVCLNFRISPKFK